MAKVKETIVSYGKSTSLKGVAKAVASQQTCLRIIWLVAFVIGGAIGLFYITTLLIKYYQYQVTTKVTVCNGCQPEYPDITLCNLNPTNFLNEFSGNITQLDEYIYVMEKYTNVSDEEVFGTSDRELLKAIYMQMFSLSGYFQNINKLHLFRLLETHDLRTKLVQFCEWFDWNDSIYSKEDCDTNSLQAYFNDEYFVCTTLHLNDSNMASQITEIKGVQAVIFLNDFSSQLMPQYIPDLMRTQANGLRVHIHPPNTLPDINKGFTVPPGHEVKISLKPVKVTRLPEPYSQCLEQPGKLEETPKDFPYTNRLMDYNYSSKAAISICKQEKIIEKCGCYVHTLPFTIRTEAKYPHVKGCLYIEGGEELTVHPNGSFELSDLDMKTLTQHIDCFLNDIDGAALEQECEQHLLCEENLYDYTVSQSTWPHGSYQLAFYCEYIRNPPCKANLQAETSFLGQQFDVYEEIGLELLQNGYISNVTIEKLKQLKLIQENFIQLKVTFDDSQMTKYMDVPSLTVEGLFGNLGGILNLWIGITFFTLVEFLDLLYRIFSDFCKENKQNSVSDSDNLNFKTKTNLQ